MALDTSLRITEMNGNPPPPLQRIGGGGGGGGRQGRGTIIYMPISTKGSGTPTTRPKTGSPV